MMTLARTLLTLLTLPAAIEAGIVFHGPDHLVGYESPRCVTLATGLPENMNASNITFVASVDEDICEDTDEILPKYNNTLIWCYDLTIKCPNDVVTKGPTEQYDAYLLAQKHGAWGCAQFWDGANQVHAEVGMVAHILATTFSGGKIPFITCEFLKPIESRKDDLPDMKPNFVLDEFVENCDAYAGHKVDVVIDENPYRPYFDNIVLKLWYRFWGVVYLYSFYDCVRAFKERMKTGYSDAKIPEMMLVMEGATMFICGLYTVIFGRWDSTFTPGPLAPMTSLFLGSSLATSLMAGLYFKDLQRAIIKMEQNQGAKFWGKKRNFIIATALCCYTIDIFVWYANVFVIPYFATVGQLVQFFGQLFCGISFIRDTNGFLKTVMSKLSESDRSRPQYIKLVQMSKCLRISAVAMFLFTFGLFLASMSGSVYKGIFSPVGGVIFGSGFVILRWIPSYQQIQMAKPSSMLKLKVDKKKVAPSKAKRSTLSGPQSSTMESTSSSMSSSSSSNSSSSNSSSSSSSGSSSSGPSSSGPSSGGGASGPSSGSNSAN